MKEEEEFFNRLAEILEEEFPKGDPCRGKALVLNAYANIIFRDILKKQLKKLNKFHSRDE